MPTQSIRAGYTAVDWRKPAPKLTPQDVCDFTVGDRNYIRVPIIVKPVRITEIWGKSEVGQDISLTLASKLKGLKVGEWVEFRMIFPIHPYNEKNEVRIFNSVKLCKVIHSLPTEDSFECWEYLFHTDFEPNSYEDIDCYEKWKD